MDDSELLKKMQEVYQADSDERMRPSIRAGLSLAGVAFTIAALGMAASKVHCHYNPESDLCQSTATTIVQPATEKAPPLPVLERLKFAL